MARMATLFAVLAWMDEAACAELRRNGALLQTATDEKIREWGRDVERRGNRPHWTMLTARETQGIATWDGLRFGAGNCSIWTVTPALCEIIQTPSGEQLGGYFCADFTPFAVAAERTTCPICGAAITPGMPVKEVRNHRDGRTFVHAACAIEGQPNLQMKGDAVNA